MLPGRRREARLTTLFMTHTECLFHDTGSGHPERPDRLRAVFHAIDETGYPDLVRREAPLATDAQLALAHSDAYVQKLNAAIPESGRRNLDPDTVVSPGSAEASRRAAGAVIAAVDAVFAGDADNAFCAVRPPGHHAEPDRAMGFCLFNNAAIGALHARQAHGIRRVAVVDFDVHHGNGTQARFRDEPELMYLSSHQWPLYPGTGATHETGIADNLVNLCLEPTAGTGEFRRAWSETGLPRLRAFAPELVIISAGFDGHERDPLASLNLTDADYGWITGEIMTIATECCDGRLVSVLEGGYDLDALQSATRVHVSTLQGETAPLTEGS